MQRFRLIVLLGIVAALLAGAWFLFSRNTDSVMAQNTDNVDVNGSGPLDGMVFTGMLGPDGQPKDIKDTFVFENGTFVSKECELRCKYPARPYFIRKSGNNTEFVSETKCPYKDAKITWRGTVAGSTIKGVSTWTLKRWYWTVEKNFEFAGTLAKQSPPVAGKQ